MFRLLRKSAKSKLERISRRAIYWVWEGTVFRGTERFFHPGGRTLGFFGHDDPEDKVDNGAREDGEDSQHGIEDADEGGVPAEPFGQSAADPPDHPVVGKS